MAVVLYAEIICQTNTTRNMRNEKNAAVIQGLYTAVNERNFEYLTTLSDAESEWFDIPFNSTVSGETSAVAAWQKRFSLFPDVTFEVQNLMAYDNYVIVQGLEKATFKGMLAFIDEDIITEGFPVEIAFCDVYYLEDGRILKANSNFDVNAFKEQICAIPA